MDLAKPGDIRHMCDINALVTLKEYLEDFAKPDVKKAGYKLIDDYKENLDDKSLKTLKEFFKNIDKGVRDEYV
jgi:2-iminoacetate synthase